MTPSIQIKGLRDGLLITVGEGSWEEIHQALLDEFDQKRDFLRGARLAIDVGNLILKAVDLGNLRNEIMERDLILWAILSDSPTTIQTAQTLGLATRTVTPRPELTSARLETSLHDGEPAAMVRKTLRSGYSIQHAGHVVVIGDVNPGAEVIASGDIVIWGKARGMLHAGAEGDEDAIVCALDLSPTQLRIAGKIAVTPQRKGKAQPEMAHLEQGQVVAQAWVSKKEK